MSKKTITLVGLVAVLATAVTFLHAASTPKDPGEGKFHLIYRVIAPKVEVGAEVEIEPALITDGNRIFFAWDYCRWHYPERNYNYKARYNVKEDRLDRKLVSSADQIDLQHYCRREKYTIRASGFSAIDNDRVHLALNDAVMVPIQHNSHAVPGGYLPGRITTTISRVTGTVKPKLPPAAEDKQPYVFLMSRNTTLLEKVVLRTLTPKPEEVAPLLARLEQYKERRRVSDPKATSDLCKTYVPDDSQRSSWQAVSRTIPTAAEVFYTDVDGDGTKDLIVRLVEDPTRLAMTRIYYGSGTEECVLRNQDGNRNSPIYRPLTLLRTSSCFYVFTQTSTYENPNMNLVRLGGSPERCNAVESYKFHEPH